MPQDRSLIAATAGLRIERVRFHATPARWSGVYRAPVRRLVLPDAGAVGLRSAGASLFIDPLTAFRVGEAMDYQLKPESDGAARTSVVVSDEAGGVLDAPQAWLLSPAALLRLRLHFLALQGGAGGDTARFISGTLQGATPMAPEGMTARHVLRARRFLTAQHAGGVTLHDVADAAHSSPFHLARSFRRQLGLSLHQYRQHLRLAVALARLEQGERDLAGLAHELGFCSQSHFGEVFRRETGLAPAQARTALARAAAGI